MLNAGSRPRRGPGEVPFAAATARYIASLWGDDEDVIQLFHGLRDIYVYCSAISSIKVEAFCNALLIYARHAEISRTRVCMSTAMDNNSSGARCACSAAGDVASARAVLMVISAIGAKVYEGVKQMMHQLFSLLVEPFDQSRRARGLYIAHTRIIKPTP
ncbi:unnamed protein product [Trichogramma brassicae]|uniref:Uncharacterized protein n=1 Tax=Trichogramma brassicae TaxID=86971 RepID=A0A6H5HVX1_9HYME|nr:unnamed protein product [Trichogramma brassicae]